MHRHKDIPAPSSRICLAGLTLKYPVVQAPLGCCDGPVLAGIVSRAGGLGTLSVHATPASRLQRQLRKIRSITPLPTLLAFTAQWESPEIFQVALQEHFNHFQVFWWNGPRLSSAVHKANATLFWQVGTIEQAREAVGFGASVLIAQGTEAGGQVRSPWPTLQLIADLNREFDRKIPIVAGGGLADKNDTSTVLSVGATAAMFGTRFLLSDESKATSYQKSRLLKASSDNLLLDGRLVGDWPCAPRRRFPNYKDEEHPAFFAGQGVGRMRSLQSAYDLVRLLAP